MSNGAATLPHPTPASNRWADLTPSIRARLERDGINSAADWRSAGARRKQIFGIPAPMVRQLDELAKEAA
jgi:hypothetical protein